MTPDVCVATVGALAPTGIDVSVMLVVAAVGIVGAGVGLVLLVGGRRRAAAFAVLALVLAVGAASMSAPVPASAATPGTVTYGVGCTLILIDDVTVASDPIELLPGDEAIAVAALVRNATDSPLRLSVADSLTAPVGDVTHVRTTVDGVMADTVDVPPRGRISVKLLVSLPTEAANEGQARTGDSALTITAAQR